MIRSDVSGWVAQYAPEAAGALESAGSLATSVVDPAIVELARLRVAQLLGYEIGLARRTEEATYVGLDEAKIAELSQWPTSSLYDETDRACLHLAEQFVIDVSGVTDDDVNRVLDVLGAAGLYGFVQALYVVEMTQRLEMSLGAVIKSTSPEGQL